MMREDQNFANQDQKYPKFTEWKLCLSSQFMRNNLKMLSQGDASLLPLFLSVKAAVITIIDTMGKKRPFCPQGDRREIYTASKIKYMTVTTLCRCDLLL
jgi:hypothetical protein